MDEQQRSDVLLFTSFLDFLSPGEKAYVDK